MFCIECGTSQPETAKFCSNCGMATGYGENKGTQINIIGERDAPSSPERENCPYCKSQIHEDASVCTGCGAWYGSLDPLEADSPTMIFGAGIILAIVGLLISNSILSFFVLVISVLCFIGGLMKLPELSRYAKINEERTKIGWRQKRGGY